MLTGCHWSCGTVLTKRSMASFKTSMPVAWATWVHPKYCARSTFFGSSIGVGNDWARNETHISLLYRFQIKQNTHRQTFDLSCLVFDARWAGCWDAWRDCGRSRRRPLRKRPCPDFVGDCVRSWFSCICRGACWQLCGRACRIWRHDTCACGWCDLVPRKQNPYKNIRYIFHRLATFKYYWLLIYRENLETYFFIFCKITLDNNCNFLNLLSKINRNPNWDIIILWNDQIKIG